MSSIRARAAAEAKRSSVWQSLRPLYQRMGTGRIVAISLAFSVAFLLYFNASENASQESPGILSLQFAFTQGTFREIVTKWTSTEVFAVRRQNLWIDLLFPLAYATFFSSLLVWARPRVDDEPTSRPEYMLYLPFVGGLFDWVENGLHLFLLHNTSRFPAALVLAASIMATIKWLLVIVSAVSAGRAAAERLLGLRR
jgi:hypothetical protein